MDPFVPSKWLHRFAVLTALATLGLLGIGGLVTSHGAGMAVPDWPTSYGYNMFALPLEFWRGGVFYEHTHRLWASEVGSMTLVLTFWLFGHKSRLAARGTGVLLIASGVATFLRGAEWQAAVHYGLHGIVIFGASFVWPRCAPAPKWLRRLGVIAFVAVLAQGILGGLRVTLFKDQLGIFHGTLAQLFFVLICSIALFTSRWWNETVFESRESHLAPAILSIRRAFFATTLLIFVQLILGATMRHQHAGLAIPDFPLAYGRIWPKTDAESVGRYNQQRQETTQTHAITAAQIQLQMVHRIVALLILLSVAACAIRAMSGLGWRNRISKITMAWLAVILAQVGLGIATILTNKAADVATAHVVAGAFSLAMGWVLVLISSRLLTFEIVTPRKSCDSQFSLAVSQTAAPNI